LLEQAAYLAFRSCISGQHTGKDAQEHLTMDYHLLENIIGGDDIKIPVCRDCFAFAFETTVASLKKFSRHYKENKDTLPVDLKTRKFTDATIPPYTWSEMETIFSRNLEGFNPGF
jgi:hypothetical protein